MKKIIVIIVLALLLLFTVAYLFPSLISYFNMSNIEMEKKWVKISYTILQILIAFYFIIRGVKYLKKSIKSLNKGYLL